ncbi:MAG TPA: hypothetical protein VNL17_12020 [Verrucomicrobiae bacterium]|nr:hypothetical protein [Verrucomicrobiae bacterium]
MMKRRAYRGAGLLSILAVSLVIPTVARAQFSANFQTNTISGVTSNWVGTFYIIGSNTFLDTLQIINGGVLSNGSCVVGYVPGGSNNTVLISGLGSMLTNRFDVYLGNDGGNNRLIVTNRGAVYSGNGYLGFNLFGTNNVALISDTGSVWRVKTNLFIGYVDGANQLIVSNGGVVSDVVGLIGSNANLNVATITGPGSMWSNSFSVVHGFIGQNNRLVVTNGGLLWSGKGAIGDANISRSNIATVVGIGSTWRNTDTLYVGDLGYSNRLEIANGGLANALSGYIGVGPSSTGNIAVVAGSGAVWSNGINLFAGYAGVGNRLIVTNGGKALAQAGTIGYTNSSVANTAWIEGAGSTWSNTVYLYVGYVGANNQLVVSNGAAVFSGTGFIGSDRVTSNNTATVVGAGAVWSSTNFIYAGYVGSSNTLVVADGGTVRAVEIRVGFDPISSNNLALITGSGALLNDTNIIVGYGGFGNQLIVSNGAVVFDTVGALGFTNQSSQNSALITGSDSAWSNSSIAYIGYKAANNQLVVADGATMFSGDGLVGSFISSSNNTATIQDPGSAWRNTNYLYIGSSGAANTLLIANGGQVSGNYGIIGFNGSSSNNLVTVTGNGSLWSNTFELVVGDAAAANQLVIANGATVYGTAGGLGLLSPATGNSAVIDGMNSAWINTSFFYVGYSGSVNQVTITNAGVVFSSALEVGSYGPGSNNTLIVTGHGSTLASTNSITVGSFGAHNVLTVAGGGAVSNAYGYIGYQTTGRTNSVLVTGSGSTWTNTTALYVGLNGLGNSLTISNGGAVYDGSYCEIGYAATSDRNSVLVTGPGSTWVNDLLYIGQDGASNTVTIANGAKAYGINPYGSSCYLGYFADSISNSVLVTGTNSSWQYVSSLYIGYSSRSNSLTVANGGYLESLLGYVGGNFGTNNFALVTDPGSIWYNDQYLYVGGGGSRNSLVVSNGGVAVGHLGGYIGYPLVTGGGNSNSALVTDAGSVWSNQNNFLYVGYTCHGNSLMISNGGAVVDYTASLGYASTVGIDGSNNFGTVTGVGSVWNNTGSFALGDGSHSNRLTAALLGKVAAANIFVGARGGLNNLLRLSNGLAQASSVNVGTGNFLTGSGTVTGGVLNNGTIDANINGATLTFSSIVKNNGALRASGGGIIEFYGPVLNFGTTNFTGGTAIFHAGIFSSSGSTNSWSFPGNDLWENGARWSRTVPPSSADSLVLITNATTKTVTVTASTFSSAPSSVNNFNIALSGPTGVTNTLGIANTPAGTPFTSVYLSIGTNAVAIVSNATVQVGTFGTGAFTVDGELRIQSGGQLDTTGVATSTVGNASVSGVGASWSNGVLTAVPGCRLSVTNGGQVFSSNGNIDGPNATGTVAGSNSTWNVASTFYLGNTGAANQSIVTNRGMLVTGSVYLGNNTSASNNMMTITGDGSVWTNQISFQIGAGVGNQLIITNGGKFVNFAFVSTVGGNPAANGNNVITVTGTNSVWTDYSYFWLGYFGGSNQLIVADGATLNGYVSEVGVNTSSSNNTVTVTGSNSVWHSTDCYIGYNSAANQLVVTNGGVVSDDGIGAVGYNATASNNTVIVTGSNSAWRNTTTLYIGNAGNSNRLEIASGSVVARNAFIGAVGTNNVVRVTGGGLFVTNALGNAALVVSSAGGLGSLIINGGSVTVDKLIATNGANSIVTLNAGSLNGRAAFVTNAQQFVVGDGASTATYHLLGGTHSFADGLKVRNASFLTGCGTINGAVVVDSEGTVLADCGGTLTFTGSVTNNGTMRAINGSSLEFYGPVVNNGVIDLINGGTTNFHGGFINNGVVLDASSVQVAQTFVSGNDFVVQILSVMGHTYQMQVTPSLAPTNWLAMGGSQSGNDGMLTFTDPGGATNVPGRFYRIDVSAP